MNKLLYKFTHPVQGNIWCLHRVMPQQSQFKENRELEISPEFFESIIHQHQSAKYSFLSLDNIIFHKLNKYRYPWQSKFVHITFDDGFDDIYHYAFPILKKYNIPFTIYVSTDMIDHKALLWWLVLEKIILSKDEIQLSDHTLYHCQSAIEKQETFTNLSQVLFSGAETPAKIFERLFSEYSSYFETGQNNILTEDQIREMIKSGLCTLGSHTVSHPILTKLSTEQWPYEIYKSKEILESRFGVPVNHFSYPYSFWNLNIEELVKQAGYRSAVLGYGGSCRYKALNVYKLHRAYITESH